MRKSILSMFSRNRRMASSPSTASMTVYPVLSRTSLASFLIFSLSSANRIVSVPFLISNNEKCCFSSLDLSRIGKYILNVVPRFSLLWTVMKPLCSFTISETTESPSPVPCPFNFVVKKGSKILSFILSFIPIPVSEIERQAYPPGRQTPCVSVSPASRLSSFVSMVRVPPSGMASRAFAEMFMMIWLICDMSARMLRWSSVRFVINVISSMRNFLSSFLISVIILFKLHALGPVDWLLLKARRVWMRLAAWSEEARICST